MKWDSKLFESLYYSIESENFNETIFNDVLEDLQSLNLNKDLSKNSSSRSQLEKGEVILSDGNKYKLNQEFIIAVVTLADDLNLDELVVCELILNSIQDVDTDLKNSFDTITLINKGKIQYFLRRQYILQIVNYIVNCLPPDSDIFKKLFNDKNIFSKTILDSFSFIHQQLSDIKQSISKAQILDNSENVVFKHNIKFKRDFLLKEYDILSQILFGTISKKFLLTKDFILKLLSHVSSLESNDFFIVYYLSSFFNIFINLNELPENDVKELHKLFTNDLKNDQNIYKKPIKVTLIFVFLAFFISWCKINPATRAKVMNFQTMVDEPMSLAVELGAIEQLLIITADTSTASRQGAMDIYYDVRSLLERHIPRLIPIQLVDFNQQISSELHPSLKEISLSEQSEHFFLISSHTVLQTIIGDCAFLLTKIKDAEEDSLLSGEDLNLDDISVKADLERFFLTIYFFYHSRPDFSHYFWSDKESNAYGFIEWAAKCTDSLMRSCFYLMISSLSQGLDNSLNVFHYFNNGNNVSWSIISQCISDYIVKINNLGNVVTQRQQHQETEEIDTTAVALEEGLNEETIIFLSSLLTLIGSVASETNEEVKERLNTLFSDILFEFSKVDTPLVGACFKTLSYLVPKSESQRTKFWTTMDTLFFKSYSLTSSSDSYRNAFTSFLTNYSEVIGFLELFKQLTEIQATEEHSNFLTFGKLTFPVKLGQGYRNIGVWPYFEYILNEVFVNSGKMSSADKRRQVQLLILEIIENALYSFNYSVILNSVTVGANLDTLVDTQDFYSYVQESSAVSVFNYLFTEKVYACMFDLLSIGVDHLSIDLEGGKEQLLLLEHSVSIINIILEYQDSYIEELSPIILKNLKSNYFIPKEFGLHGLRSFYDAIFFNISIIAHLGLYIGLDTYSIAKNSLQILKRISIRSTNESLSSSRKNKLLTIFDSVDESSRIKEAFITQIEKPIDSSENLSLKFDILEFISSTLSLSNPKPTIAHQLLGFQVTNVISLGPILSTFIGSDVSLFKSLINLLKSSVTVISRGAIDYPPMRLASNALEILLKLCKNPVTSNLILDYMTNANVYEVLMNLDPQVNKYTLWNGRIFDDNSSSDCKEFFQTESIGALLSFLSYRGFLLQYLSLTIHRLSFNGLKSQISSFIKSLISNTMYSAGIFSFLDTSDFGNIHRNHFTPSQLDYLNKLVINLDKIKLNNTISGNIYDFSDLEPLLNLACKTKSSTSTAITLLPNNNSSSQKDILVKESLIIKQNISNHLSHTTFMNLQLSIVHSWVQLVQIIVTDGNLSPLVRSNFILEVFGTVIPKINDYVEFDIAYSEELVSLAVFLYDIYRKDRLIIDKSSQSDPRLYDLFKACVHGINSSITSIGLRSDFYVLANNYLVSILKDESQSREVLQDLKMNSNKLVDIICNDAIFGEGTNRITGILLLDSLVQLANYNKENFVLETLTKGTHLLLIIRSLKNINSMLENSNTDLDLDTLLYELTALKTTVYFVIRVAETRNGAQALVQNKLFTVIEECTFLELDPDLGLELVFDESQGKHSNIIRVSVSLDNPLDLGTSSNGISLFEFTVPIFQLMLAVLLSMGSSNKVVIQKVRNLLIKFKRLSLGVLKRDALRESKESYHIGGSSLEGLQQMVKLIVTLSTLTRYTGEDKITVHQLSN
ncbi:hypothetical protein Kpol_543p73 [Vanderwaltozyma polyspora DSM 70294]|uniref:Nucleoporin NUP192 n=1 Tax=Vanderwaltozyma polyspora (strain ATCC 22028 / DSM 70294 / BCRC 21397 / CBS 2163 / NBRC 10782 / NRRL Y-8283 / UCD 57-17) TaxID=436907 RepID=A7THS7_VANPO|nr:uncharacterized protein Kpol_543p73 [Vanderwaltozyma polyspora DSM 70294]EDO18243.1 hypothetical protein Kpol_543p73 [Vanderwaltozyma polyspora DSM 70294]